MKPKISQGTYMENTHHIAQIKTKCYVWMKNLNNWQKSEHLLNKRTEIILKCWHQKKLN